MSIGVARQVANGRRVGKLPSRLAVARSHQGGGFPRTRVRDALVRTRQVAEIAGTRALLVHALHEHAAGFYWHRGFVASVFGAHVLMSPLATARRSLGC